MSATKDCCTPSSTSDEYGPITPRTTRSTSGATIRRSRAIDGVSPDAASLAISVTSARTEAGLASAERRFRVEKEPTLKSCRSLTQKDHLEANFPEIEKGVPSLWRNSPRPW